MGKIIIRRVGISEFVEEALNVFLDPRAELTKEQALKLIETLEKEHNVEISWEIIRKEFPPSERIVVKSYRFKAEEFPKMNFLREFGTLENASRELGRRGYIIESINL